MDRRKFLAAGAVGTAASALAAPAIAQDKRQWKMVTAWPKNLPGPGVAAQNLADRITTLKSVDAHFARMVERYHELNRAIHRAETNVEPTDDLHMVEMRKERMHLKDQVAAALNQPA